MAMDKKLKKQVTEDWLNSFPSLCAFTQNKLLKVFDSTILGIELIKSRFAEEYSPYIVIYPLWKNNIDDCLDAPYLMMRMKNRKGLQLDLAYNNHHICFIEAKEFIIKQIPFSLNGDIKLKELFDFIDGQFVDILVKSNSAQQAKLFELKFNIALYEGDTEQIQNVLNQIQQASIKWKMDMFEMWYGKFDLWFQALQGKITKRDALLTLIDSNKSAYKVRVVKRLI